MNKSIGEYFYSPTEPEGHRCGYCKTKDGSASNGLWAHTLTVEDYQDLVDRGWRRSGKYCYKPLMTKTCCPLYTISCHAAKFRLSKSQKSVLKKVRKYLTEGECKKSKGPDKTLGDAAHTSSGAHHGSDMATAAAAGAKTKKVVQPGKGADPAKSPCQKAKELRRERKKRKLASSVASEPPETSAEPVQEMEGGGGGGGGKVASGSAKLPSFMERGEDGRKALEEFLTPLDTPSVSSEPADDKKTAHRLEMRLVKSSPPSPEFTATFTESHALFKKYQMSVHKEKEEDCTEKKYTRFLCTSPLIPSKGCEGWPRDYGSYHQHYRIDGKLVAVGVVDILPKCLSSVYLYYDPDYEFLNLGVYSALREIELTRQLHLSDPANFKYYYMGFYIHSCQKMRYKGDYTPSFLLCPESYTFVPIESCLPKLDSSKYSRLNDRESVAENVSDWLGRTLVLFQRTYMSYEQFTVCVPGNKKEAEVKQYAELVGPKVATRMLLVLDG